MKNIFYLFIFLFLCSCNNDKKDTTQKVIATPTGLQGLQKPALLPAQKTENTLIFNPKHGEPGHTCALAEGAPLNQTAAKPQQISNTAAPAAAPQTTASAQSKNLNPEHGKPGHRCDLSVGAPLDSKPDQNTAKP